jgi:hypothetical protein
MANEFKHKDPGTEITQAEYISSSGDGHIFACQATGDILYASSTTVLKNLGKGAANTVLNMGGSCIPAWTASPSVTDLTIGGGCITLSAATDIDLLDNTASALSFDATGKTGIIDIVTTNCSEGVTMSGTLGVTGVFTASAGIELGHASDTTIARSGSGAITVEGNQVYLAGGTDVPVSDGGTGASTLTANGILVGNGTSAIAVTATMATKGHLMVGDGSGVPSMLAVGGTCDHVLTVDSGEATGLKWAAAAGGCVVCDTSPQLGGSLDAQNNTILNVGAATNDWTSSGIDTAGYIDLNNGSGSAFLTVETTATNTVAQVLIKTAASSNQVNDILFVQGSGNGSANNMGWNLGYFSCGAYFRLRSNDTDGSSTDACIWRVPDGQTTIDANTTWDANVFDDHDDAMVLWRAFSPEGQRDLDSYALGKAALQTTKSELADIGVLKRYYKPCGAICEDFLGYNDQRMAALLAGGIYQTRFTVDKNHECHEARLKALEAKIG